MADVETKAAPSEEEAPATAAENEAAPAAVAAEEELPSPEADAAAVAAVIDETGAGSAYLSDISSVHGMIRWVRRRGVRFVDYPALARQFALLQTDGKHWTHYAFPCHDQAPELTRFLAQLTMQAAMDRPLDVCGGEGVR